MNHGIPQLPPLRNEPIKSYAPGSPERSSLQAELARMRQDRIEIPAVIGGREIRTGSLGEIRSPHDHARVLASFHRCGPAEVEDAIRNSLEARADWAALPWEQRLAVFLKAADLLAGPWRDRINASTMLGQSKNAFQAEIDSACELIDFWRINAHFAAQIYAEQPVSPAGQWNRSSYRPLEGYVLAVPPFNFTSISGNLPTAPAMLGNVALWKPASTAVLSSYLLYKLLEEAGLPPGVINFVPGSGSQVGAPALASPDLAGLHFTGSTGVFQSMWREIGQNIERYKTYPRIVGETGGKDFVVAHASADPQALAVALVRGAYEYQGQKCSAASRAYVPASMWPNVKDRVLDMLRSVTVGPSEDFSHFMNAVIDEKAFDKISGYIDGARSDARAEILSGGGCDKTDGYYIQPTLIQAQDPDYRTMCEEIFGPVLSLYVYEDTRFAETLEIVDQTSPYSLTGAIFAQDRYAVEQAMVALENSAGNFYINDKPTGAVVGQQPFGGARASGTNDKAGAALNLTRWLSARSIKETFDPPLDYRYPFMQEG